MTHNGPGYDLGVELSSIRVRKEISGKLQRICLGNLKTHAELLPVLRTVIIELI
jgi:hypothetical protein